MKAKILLSLLSCCVLLLSPRFLCAQETICAKCLKKFSNCRYHGKHPKCKTCGRICGAKVNPCPHNGKHPKCATCDKLRENCSYKGTHPYVSGTHAGHDYADLGLSVKWATCNVGATSPEDYGHYYAWGETSTKDEYYSENCTTENIELSDISGNVNYDAARANWGGNWRMPTETEFKELRDNCNCELTIQNGMAGMRYTSKKNGNSIFLPAAGTRYGKNTTVCGEPGMEGVYWTSTVWHGGSEIIVIVFSSDREGRRHLFR